MSTPSLLLMLTLTGCLAQPAVHAKPTLPTAYIDAEPQPELSIPEVAERAIKSVVNISTTRQAPQQPIGPLFSDPFFRDFLGPRGPGMPMDRRASSLGSGVIIGEDGVVLTNHHVVGDAERIEVTLHDGKRFDADVVGSDPRSDLAVLRLRDTSAPLVALPMGDSAQLRLGEPVLAIGNPFGIGQTVTQGIISATGRANLGIVDYEDFIQTDAAINPGNSGGALVSLRGELVGINTAIVSRSGGYQGIGFAIPSNMASQIVADLLRDGAVQRGYLGVVIQDLTPELADAIGSPAAVGVLVSEVSPSTPAERAGFARGDVITQLNDTPVTTSAGLRMAVAAAGPNTPFSATVLREGRSRTLKGTLDALPDDPAAPPTPSEPIKQELSLAPLDAATAQRLPAGVDGGVLVRSVAPGSPAARAGLRPGDVVLQANNKPVRTPAEAYAALAETRVLLLISRGGTTLFIVVGR